LTSQGETRLSISPTVPENKSIPIISFRTLADACYSRPIRWSRGSATLKYLLSGRKHLYRRSADLQHDAEDFRYDNVFRRVASNADCDLVQQQIFKRDYLSIFYNFSNIWLKAG
jgi:hypothetical protein